MRKYLYVFIICFSVFTSNAYVSTVKAQFGTGIAYNFNFSSEIFSPGDSYFFQVPVFGGVSIRFHPLFSLYTGLDVLYSFHSYAYKENLVDQHNLFINIHSTPRFHIMSDYGAIYENFYVATGLFLHFWPLSYYCQTNKNKEEGNSFLSDGSIIQKQGSYTFGNIGTKVAIGNSFNAGSKGEFGFELFMTYMFVPYMIEEVSWGNKVFFKGSVGINFFVGIITN